MILDEIVTWYQKKIGTYDKQEWEKTVEQKIIDGFTSFTLKNAKLKTEFIDVDLVRGSTFPKAKAKQTLLTVIRLAVLRYLLFPIYAQWWVKQTSPNIFGILLFLYATQIINWTIYSIHVHRLEIHDSEHIVTIAELLIPMTLSLFLSLIHSQIVATNSGNGVSSKAKRHCSTNGKPRERIRRRRKLVKVRNQDSLDNTTSSSRTGTAAHGGLQSCSSILIQSKLNSASCFPTPSSGIITSSPVSVSEKIPKIQLDLIANDDNNEENSCFECLINNKKRNVNWDSPIHNFAAEHEFASCSQKPLVSATSSDSNTTGDDIANSSIDKSVQEFYDDLIRQTDNKSDNYGISRSKRNVGEDDGFESLNGKSSSGEEYSPAALKINKFDNLITSKNSLRFRTNAVLAEPSQKKSDDLIKPTGMRRKGLFYSELDFDKTAQQSTGEIFLPKKTSASAKTQQRSRESSDTDEESDEGDGISNPSSLGTSNYADCTTSATEWLGVTTNSEECSYSSELDNSDCYRHNISDDDGYDLDFTPATILNAHGSSDRVSCTVWEQQEIKKAEMSVLDISSCIIERVEAMPETCDYIFIGVFFSIALSLIPCICRLCEITVSIEKSAEISYFDVPMLLWEKASFSFLTILQFAFGETRWERTLLIIGFIQRLCLTFILFIIFAVAERAFKQRFLYAKLFSHLTSSRRARKSNLPHFRLNKVRNIKTWLSVRSYLKKRGPQRSVDVIVSAAFIVTLFLLSFLSVEWLKDSVHLHSRLNIEALMWSAAIVIFLLRFMTLGNKINRKYRSISVLITEQINLYLQIEQKPKKKDELMVSNSVLKLAGDLLKELESPFKISGLSANPYLFTTIKVVILSALSGVLSEILGFKLKLHKIKIK